MNGYQYIIAKQTEWAHNQGIELISKTKNRGRLGYTKNIDDNFFKPLLLEVKAEISSGDGGELGTPDKPGKIQALHSSSALGVNVFQYWKSISMVPVIAAACGFCKNGSTVSNDLKFEEKYPINDSFGFHPNIDVVLHNRPGTKYKQFAIECKFSEAYGSYKHGGIDPKYFDKSTIWEDIPKLKEFAELISPNDDKFKYLHPAQLIKHILGLKRKFGKSGFRLLYLWYDVLGEQGKNHQDEIIAFTEVTKSDGIKFHSLIYQKLIASMANKYRNQHFNYIRYLTERYL